MTKYLNLDSWPRRKHFELFRAYEKPFFNLCSHVDITRLRSFTKERNISFFIASLFVSTSAANAVEEFRYRLREDRVLIHGAIHAGSTILNEDDTFGFCYFDWTPSFTIFESRAKRTLKESQKSANKLDAQDERDDLIHHSVIPWVSFTSFSHARWFRDRDSVPKIVFGKYFEDSGSLKLPLSVEGAGLRGSLSLSFL